MGTGRTDGTDGTDGQAGRDGRTGRTDGTDGTDGRAGRTEIQFYSSTGTEKYSFTAPPGPCIKNPMY